MLLHEFFEKNDLNEVIIDNQRGLGAVPDNDNVDYKGIRVKMRPSIFLELAEYTSRNELPNVDKLKNLIKK